jgi:RNA polymerase sigma factor (sigma-70 family)
MPASTDPAPLRTSLADFTDTGLLELTRAGDDRAYGEIWKRHVGAATSISRSVTTRIDSADIVAESFARMLQAIRNGTGPTRAVRSYLAVTIRTVAAGWGKAMPPTVELDQAPELGFVDERFDRIDDLHSLDRAAAAFKTLPERWQNALWYREVEGLSNSEIGEIMNLAPAAVAMLTSRARAGLRRAWQKTDSTGA